MATAAIAAAAPAIIAALSSLFGKGKPDKQEQRTNKTPGQMGGLENILQQLGVLGAPGGNFEQANQYNSRMLSGDPKEYQQWAQPYINQFQEETIPNLENRYAAAGGGMGGGLGSSSGYAQALGGAHAKHQSNLAGIYAQLQQQASQQAFSNYQNLGSLGIGPNTFENTYQPGSVGIGQQAAAGFSQGASNAFGKNYGNLISDKLSNWFNQNKSNQNQEQNSNQVVQGYTPPQ